SSRRQRVMLQVETGDEREGVPVEQLADLAAAVSLEPRLELAGLATNYACFRGAPAGIRWSVDTVCKAARELRAGGIPVPRVSAGNSSVLALILRGDSLPSEVTELRCGEALLLGQEALSYQPIPGCRQDACLLRAEVVEEYTKPTPAQGKRRLVLSIGRQDLGSGAVRFTQPGLNEIGRSSDYLVVEVDPEAPRIRSGQMVEMIPSYEALVAAWTSPYVELALR
ncbi:MAG: alanine racemase, partial [Thermoleophilia bacterium]|nr:alanine racemase [Thermoleophilia bacterium]